MRSNVLLLPKSEKNLPQGSMACRPPETVPGAKHGWMLPILLIGTAVLVKLASICVSLLTQENAGL